MGSHHTEPEPWVVHRVRALESLLIEKGLLSTELVDKVVQTYEKDIGPMNGAKVVARAWVDPAYKQRLLADGTAAIAELGFTGRGGGDKMVVHENTPPVGNMPGVHNMVVCTLCSCYPWIVLGLPPVWYKSPAYRSRAVLEPRKVLAEFGVELPKDTEIRVWDSSAEIRYMVLPMRPEGTGGLSEAELAALVTRDAMIGVALVQAPTAAR
jgi:nitrile hydratase subunit alpha